VHEDWFRAINITARAVKIVLDVTLFSMFAILLAFFIVRKKEKLQQEQSDGQDVILSTRHKLTITYIIFVYVLNAYHAVMSQVFGIMKFSEAESFQKNKVMQLWYLAQDNIFVPIIDFLTLIGLVYLFSI
jgi:hypothetical protein